MTVPACGITFSYWSAVTAIGCDVNDWPLARVPLGGCRRTTCVAGPGRASPTTESVVTPLMDTERACNPATVPKVHVTATLPFASVDALTLGDAGPVALTDAPGALTAKFTSAPATGFP